MRKSRKPKGLGFRYLVGEFATFDKVVTLGRIYSYDVPDAYDIFIRQMQKRLPNSVVQKNNNTVAVVFADDLQDLNKFVNGFMPRIPILSSKGPAEFYIHVLSTRDMFNITLVSSGMWVRIDGTYTVSSTTVILPMIVEDTVNSFYFPAKALQI